MFHDSPLKNRFVGAVQHLYITKEKVASKDIETVGIPYGLAPTTARRLWRKFVETGSTHTRRGLAPRRKLSFGNELELIAVALEDRFMTLAELGRQIEPPVSDRLVHTVLENNGLHRRHAHKVPRLTQRHRDARLEWALEHTAWEDFMWDWVIWSDECYIVMGEKKGIVWVTRAVVRHPQCTVMQPY
jgi:hypothetical protein